MDWQLEAVRQFPDLAVKDSKLNQQYVAEYQRLKAANPQFFSNPRWPMTLASQCDGQLRVLASPPATATALTPFQQRRHSHHRRQMLPKPHKEQPLPLSLLS